MAKQNSFKGDFEKEPEVKKTSAKSRKSRNPIAFVKDEKFQRITGVVLVLSALYLLLALISYFFSWKNDQDIAYGLNFETLRNLQPGVAENWMGLIGAWIGHHLIFRWLGFGAFVFVPIIALAGWKLLFNQPEKTLRAFAMLLLPAALWVSVFMGAIFGSWFPIAGGGFGYFGYGWLKSVAGWAGAPLTLLLSATIYSILAFNLRIPYPSFLNFKTKEKPDMPTEENLAAAANEETHEAEIEMEDGAEIPDILLKINDETDEPIEKSAEAISLNVNTPKTEIPATPATDALVLDIIKPEEPEPLPAVAEVARPGSLDTPFDPTLELSSFKMPTLDLLKDYGEAKGQINAEELEANKNLIIETLRNYNIAISQIKATIGPTVTLYEIVPEAGVRIARIKSLEDDIALSLAALGIRIIAPIPGKGTIGIEVPNKNPEVVSMRSAIGSQKFSGTDMDLPLVLGRTISNEVYITDLAKMPHLLMAGATGQGKSVGINALLVSLLYKKHPATLKLVLVDPKKVELTLYKVIEHHYLAKLPGDGEAVITDNKVVINTLNSLCVEMDNRYNLLTSAGVRNLKEYNTKFIARKLNPNDGHKFLPYIVVVMDEFADLIMTAGKEVEHPIARLAQLARAIGIHLVLATQRPSVNIITGTIKANFPGRVAFRVASKIDSRTILDSGGADQLIGKGDMLFTNGNDIVRLQCPFVDTPEVEDIVNFIGNQRGYGSAYLLPEVKETNETGSNEAFDPNDRDSMFEDAARIVVQHQQGSTSLIQRRLKLGYNRAGRLIDQLENAGIVGPFEGSKAREVLIPDEYALEQLLKNLQETKA